MSEPIAKIVDIARAAAEAGAAAAMQHYTPAGIAAETKADRSPVTVADRAAETAIIAVIREAFPHHALLTEESGTHPGEDGQRWIIDPLDGTRGFSRGGKFWGPLVGFERDGEVVAGCMVLPVLKKTYFAGRGTGAFCGTTRLRLSAVNALEDATLSVGELGLLLRAPHGRGIADLIRAAASTRGYGDLASVALFLDGQADVWLEAGVQTWDLAPHWILIEEAGGKFTDFSGARSIAGGCAIGSNGSLHDVVLRAIQGASDAA